jgi:hypothetical protein
MRKWMLAGAIALAMVGSFLDRDVASAAGLEGAKVTEVKLAEIKGLLKLTAAQEPLWARLESALRSIAREQGQDESAGLVRRVSRRIVAIVFDDGAMQRLKSAAQPLLASLTDEQKSTARRIAVQMGLADIVSVSY